MSHFQGRTILAISGKQRAGKDTLAALLIERLASNLEAPQFTRVGLADALKIEWAVAQEWFLPDDNADIVALVNERKATDASVRAGLIAHGEGRKRRARNDALWVDKALAVPGNLIIPDLRYLVEVERLYREAVFPPYRLPTRILLARVECTHIERARRAESAGGALGCEDDASECELDGFRGFDVTLWNDRPGRWDEGVAQLLELLTS